MSDNNTINNEQSSYGAAGGSGEIANIAPTYKQKGGAGGYSDKNINGYTNNSTINGLSRPLFANGREVDTFNNLIGRRLRRWRGHSYRQDLYLRRCQIFG